MIVYKYQLNLNPYEQGLALPVNSKVISFQMQNDIPTIWVQIPDQYANTDYRQFKIVATGEKIHDGYIYTNIGSVQHGEFVWHLFEVKYSNE